MLSLLLTVLGVVGSALRTRGALALENLALRQQLAVLRRPRPPDRRRKSVQVKLPARLALSGPERWSRMNSGDEDQRGILAARQPPVRCAGRRELLGLRQSRRVSSGPYQLKVRVTGLKDPYSSGTTCNIDRVLILGG